MVLIRKRVSPPQENRPSSTNAFTALTSIVVVYVVRGGVGMDFKIVKSNLVLCLTTKQQDFPPDEVDQTTASTGVRINRNTKYGTCV